MAVMPPLCTRDLKVHIAEEILQALMSTIVIQREPSVIRPQEMPATGALIGTPAAISASVLPQMDACEVEPLELSTSETRRSAGELLHRRDDRQQCALGQRRAHFAATGAAAGPGFTHGEGKLY